MHRIEAAKLCGKRSINARFVDCSDEDAFMLAVKSNTLHGLPLSRADRIAGAKRILDWHADWSDRAVAATAGLSAKTIAGLRYRSGGEVQELDKRLGRDGKRRPVTGIEGRKRAAEYLVARPDASLREVAKEADVSLGTVHDVRSKLRRGVDPTGVGRPRSSQGQPVIGSATNACRDWSSISSKLAKDPSIRYTESGRMFLRWITSHTMQPGEWQEFVNAVPAYWTEDISLVAESVGDAWQEFADQLRARQNTAV
jgi:ParB-like chromosome segregation protein Spo0J